MVLTVSQMTQAIKVSLESTFPNVAVEGEVSNCKLQASGHLYFSLKDAGAQIGAVMFRGSAVRLKRIPKDGDQVTVKGDLNVYPPSGRYQIVVRTLEHAGLGELLLKLEALKKKLHGMGWFKKEHKKPLPSYPKRIGVVTSPTGAAIQDILNILTRRYSGFHLILYPVRVQGSEAPGEIVQAIKDLDTYKLVDVMIVGRGGGSMEDLWAFNEESVAEAIYHCKTPIIAAVGHETDHCIAEYVADVRAPTPSAAAEIVMEEKGQILDFLEGIGTHLERTIRHQIHMHRQQLNSILQQPAIQSPYPLLGPWIQKLDEIRTHLDSQMIHQIREKKVLLQAQKKHLYALQPTLKILQYKQKLAYYQTTLQSHTQRMLALKKERLEKIVLTLKSIDPKNLLKKGYSILFSEKDRSIITSVAKLTIGQNVRTLFADGEAVSTVSSIEFSKKDA